VAFVQLPWTPGEVSQAADRVHRIGQDGDVVTIFNLVAEGTVEETMSEMIISKGLVMDAVLDSGEKVNTLDLRIEGK
jgi:SNF2 family DNA or RNA helicase